LHYYKNRRNCCPRGVESIISLPAAPTELAVGLGSEANPSVSRFAPFRIGSSALHKKRLGALLYIRLYIQLYVQLCGNGEADYTSPVILDEARTLCQPVFASSCTKILIQQALKREVGRCNRSRRRPAIFYGAFVCARTSHLIAVRYPSNAVTYTFVPSVAGEDITKSCGEA